jgi:transmembrane sensor
MDELIVRHMNGETTDLEEHTLRRWRTESPDHERKYREVAGLWRLSSEGGGEVVGPPAVGSIVAEAERRRHAESLRTKRRKALRSPWLGYGLGAAAVLTLLTFMLVDREGDAGGSLLSPVESHASAGDVVTMSLSDGSVLRLAASTTVEFPRAEDRREVALAGRAFFAVASSPEPFVVHTALGDVTAHGTRFEVSVQQSEIRVVVVEGVVSLGRSDISAEVIAGQVAYLSEDTGVRVVSRDDVWSLLDWTGGLLLFQATPLSEVAEELERHFGLDVILAEELASLRITAWFADEGVEEVVSAICVVAGAECRIDDASITIRGAENGSALRVG